MRDIDTLERRLEYRLGLTGYAAGGAVDPLSYAESSPISGARLGDAVMGITKTTVDGTYLLAKYAGFAFQVKGTSCTIKIDGSGSNTGLLYSTVDGGTESAQLDRNGNDEIVLFSGLTDDWHTVSVRVRAAFGNSLFVPLVSDALVATGADPQFLLPSQAYTVHDTTLASAGQRVAHGFADFLPAFRTAPVQLSTPNNASTTNSIAFDGTFSRIFVWAPAFTIYVQIDGGIPVLYEKDLYDSVVVDVDPGPHRVNMWTNTATLTQGTLSIGTLGSETASGSGIISAHTYGHSIVAGAFPSVAGDTSFLQTSGRNGYVGSMYGRSGANMAFLATNVATAAAAFDIASTSIAVVDIGRNDGPEAMSAAEETSYNSILDDLVSAGYEKILCLGAMPIGTFSGAENPGALNDSIETLVNARTDVGVTFTYIDRAAYEEPPVTTADGTHPTRDGYLAISELDKTYMDPLF